MLNLAGKGAIITGTRRVGATVVRRLAREGVRPAIIYRSSREEADSLRDSVAEITDRAIVLQADVSNEDDVKRAVETAQRELGNLTFCLNLASDYPRKPFEQLTGADWDRAMGTAKGAYLLGLHASRAFAVNPGPTRGHIIFFGDWAAGETPYHEFLPYLTSKAAIHFMTRAFAVELAPHGVLVNTIQPGPTSRPPDMSDAEWDEALDGAPLHRESSEEEMAELIATLLKFETMTGENIRVDSGRHVIGTVPKR